MKQHFKNMKIGKRRGGLSLALLVVLSTITWGQMMKTASPVRRAALADPAYHAEVLLKRPLYPPQIEATNLIERHIANQTGRVITVRSARQTMKNEISALLCARMMSVYRGTGGIYVRTAPTWKPQIINSMSRVELFLRKDPLIEGYRPRWGFSLEVGNASIQFLSTDKKANVVGATASIALDIDEAHRVDRGKYEEDFGPMTAFNNVPVIMWGVAADKQDLLYEYLLYNLENDPTCVLQYPAAVWCELRPAYARHYEERRSKLGATHPVIQTQYDLVDVDSLGGYFKPHHVISLLDSDHERRPSPKGRSKTHICTIDIGGEAEQEEDDPLVQSKGARDSTIALIWEVNFKKLVNDLPMCHLADIYWWTGKALAESPSGLPGQQEILLKLLNLWKPVKTIVDSRGVGEQIAKFLEKRYSGVEPYAASAQSVSDDCYSLLAMVNNDRVKVFQNDQSPEYRELCRQIKNVKYEIRQHELMRIIKPGPSSHIDMVKAMTYLGRATTDVRQFGGIHV